MNYQQITFNLKPIVKNARMQDKDWLVAPMVMMVEGVLEGNCGPILYPFDAMAEVPMVWNNKPVVVYHPEENGKNISACSPEELSLRSIGVIMNAKAEDGKLLAEAWLDPERIDKVDKRIAEAIENETTLELSTGLFMDIEEKEGTFNEVEYTGIASNFRPDHLAVLPDLEGACSVKDGAGFIRVNMKFNSSKITNNELSFESIRDQLSRLIRESMPEDEWAWVENVFNETFIYERENKLYEQKYETSSEDIINLVGVPVEVIRVVSYELIKNEKKGNDMDKEKVVNDLISNENTDWTEDDRESLMALNEVALAKIPVINKKEETEKTPVQNAAEKGAAELTPDDKELTVNEYIEGAPKEIQQVLRHGVATYNQQRTKLVEAITANDRNTFTKEYLEAKDIQELEAIANLCAPAVDETKDNRFNYEGMAPVSNASEEECLELPSTKAVA